MPVPSYLQQPPAPSDPSLHILANPAQLALDYEADACFEGQLPVAAVCTFGRLIIPLVHTQPAPPAAGGGMLMYAWLPPDEANELVQVVGGSMS